MNFLHDKHSRYYCIFIVTLVLLLFLMGIAVIDTQTAATKEMFLTHNNACLLYTSKYNGMTAEQFVWAWIKSEFLMPKKLMFLPDNLYYETVKPTIEAYEKGLSTVRKKQKGRTCLLYTSRCV